MPVRKNPRNTTAREALESRRLDEPMDRVEILQSVLESLPEGVIVADLAGSYRIFNSAARQVLGVGPQDLHPTDWTRADGDALLDGSIPDSVGPLPLDRALRGEEIHGHEIFIRNSHVPNGRWIEASAGPWKDAAGTNRGAVILLHDIDEKKSARETNERLLAMVEKAERLRSRKQRAQVNAGRAIQQRLYPKEAPSVPGFDIVGAAYPADSLCGDYYDFFPMLGDGFGLTVADVCGHGIGPSILMAQARAYLRMLARSHVDVGEILRQLNEILTVEGSQREFVTQILVRLDPEARALVYANAGHPPGILVSGTGDARRELRPSGIPLGFFADRTFASSSSIPLETGDVLVLFTDGLTECPGADGEELGRPRVVELIQNHRHRCAAEILAALGEEVAGFRAGPQVDDMTLIVAKVE